jgi:group I intron endonuclease
MYIYKTTCLISNKFYIGLSKFNPEENPNYLGSGFLLKKSIKKHGRNNFKKEIIEVCDNKEILCERERYWIKKLCSNKREIGYNICEGGQWGDNWKNHPNKEELRKKASKRVMGKKNPNYGNKWSDEQKDIAKNRVIKRGGIVDKETNENFAKLPNIRKKISESKMGIKNPNGCVWKIISPTGEENIIYGGIKRKIKRFGLDYQQFSREEKIYKNKTGWVLIKNYE